MSSLCFVFYYRPLILATRVICIARETPWETTNLSFASTYQLEIASGLETKACVHFLTQCWDPIKSKHVQSLYMLTHSVSSYVHWSCVRRSCFLGVLHKFWLLHSFYLHMCVDSWTLRREIVQKSHLGLSISRYLMFCIIQLLVSLFVPKHYRSKLLWML